jgi:hypothetical protein
VRPAVIVLAVALLGAACAKPSAYIVPVTKFRDASAVVIKSTQAYLTALNKTEREHYINDQVASHGPILLNKIEEVQVFGAGRDQGAGQGSQHRALESLREGEQADRRR